MQINNYIIKILYFISLLISVYIFSGCPYYYPVKITKSVDWDSLQPESNDVEVFMESEVVSKPFRIVGKLFTQSIGSTPSEQQLIKKMTRRASDFGVDALIGVHGSEVPYPWQSGLAVKFTKNEDTYEKPNL